MCLIPGSIDVDGLVMLLVSNGESSFVVSVHPYCYIFGCYSMSLSACLVIPDGCCCFVQFSFCGLVLVYLLCLFGINEFYVHGTVHLSNNSFIKIPTRCKLFCLFDLFFTTLHVSVAVRVHLQE